MISNFKQHSISNFPYLLGKKLLIACSGGLDSVVLTHLMKSSGYQIALAHCNFSLRGKESDGDEMFVIGFAKQLEIPVFAETFDTLHFAAEHKISTQMAARTLRYNWFDEVLRDFNFDFLLTAHHLDDDLETFFINLSRGTGLNGLTGIPSKNEKIVRPILNFSREEILRYAEKNKLKWREDSTNLKTDYLRNKLRLDVLPAFKKTNKTLLKNFQKTQKNLLASQALVEDYMALVYNLVVSQEKDSYKININKLKELPHTDELLFELLNSFGFKEWQDISNLMDAQSGKRIFSNSHQLLKNREELILSLINFDDTTLEFPVPKAGIEYPIHLKISTIDSPLEYGPNLENFDAEKLVFPLKLRKWQEGDIFHPIGMNGKKKLSKFFKDEKLSLNEKNAVWLLLSEDKIIWVIGHRMDELYKVTEDTKEILQIRFNSNS